MKRNPSLKPISVLVVEDSRSQQELLVGLLRSSGEFIVVGTASNGQQAIAAAQRLRPQVIAMDIYLPILDGYAATTQIMQQCPTPIVLISSSGDAARRSIEALAAGALAVVHKPSGQSGTNADAERAAFLTTLRLMADVQVVTRYPLRAPTMPQQPLLTGQFKATASGTAQVLAIAASTGGPAALQIVLQGLGAAFRLPILIVQHITRGFVPALVSWLNATVPLPVRIACQNEQLLPGQIYLAPDDYHLTICQPGRIGLRPATSADRFCPSADPLFESIAQIYGARAIGVILTGMGNDGTRGLLALHAAGAPTLAQDAASCVVYGMPRAAVEAGAITRSAALAKIPEIVLELVGSGLSHVKAV
jgi:two-component system, chemotaxis family, protein-glutamate methylesterase/glutaminase